MHLRTRPATGRLFIWTDVDCAWEADFNRWYDREHMQECVSIPGVRCARRLHALVACPRPYVAFYDAESLDVYRSAAYRDAFANQTAWARASIGRMRATQRRVGILEHDEGLGEGAAVALFAVPASKTLPADAQARLREAHGTDGVVRTTLLRTDPDLSTPVGPAGMRIEPDVVVIVEATRSPVALAQALSLAESFDVEPGTVYAFQTLWRLGR